MLLVRSYSLDKLLRILIVTLNPEVIHDLSDLRLILIVLNGACLLLCMLLLKQD